MDFGFAIQWLRDGKRVQRSGWNGKGMWLRLVGARDGDRAVSPTYPQRAYIEMKAADGWLVPWLASQTDVLADDWRILESDEAW